MTRAELRRRRSLLREMTAIVARSMMATERVVSFSHVEGARQIHRLQGGGGPMKGKFFAFTFCGIRLEGRRTLVRSDGPTTCKACRRAMKASLGKVLA